ncbi:FAD:protein FMN transferase [Microbacterium gilvum]|uniref:FAD:protein FMN transferase n=1 Tax=Microbacterium gilvum TaxID=1336204 RepID=A0ABP9A7D5_9MICO
MRASREWPLWSTTARVVVDDPSVLDDAVRLADAQLARIDEAASRFRSDSELNRVAPLQHAGVEVSSLLALLVQRGLDAALLTGGLVDPTLGHSIDRAGYDRDIRFVESDDAPVKAIVTTRPGWRSVRLAGTHLTVPGHLALDLGASAKAVAADLVAREIARETGASALVSLGGDIATAGEEPHGGWHISAQDGPGQPKQVVRMAAGTGIATSSTLHRTWRRGGEPMHHIIDPRTGLPAPPVWRSVSVSAESCFVANALSTAAVVLGESAPAWLAGRAPARLVRHDGRVVTVGGWPTPVLREEVRHG